MPRVKKNVPMQEAAFGIVGLETAFPLLYTHFVKTGEWTLKQLLDWMTVKPAEAFKLPYGKLAVGDIADITIIDLAREKDINPDEFLSKGKNTPFAGVRCSGYPVVTIAAGKVAYKEEA